MRPWLWTEAAKLKAVASARMVMVIHFDMATPLNGFVMADQT
jgi:hypothetical protein